ncbi:hypothetical protein [Planosporangium mesophilum]|uniref:Uncharacterized protein n=1 Tax=Planosporangium mesophilum TaxID=689768 RepID=A0A8J3TJD6_9ACTN|nr:hypothetical protein [Planosporangium mesophilum]NJC86199.1 hypothetical protein [Planosporangium mesophilum]GII25709.1 hypothetical protein Pme01_53060 [Planosporangium mesophilum]
MSELAMAVVLGPAHRNNGSPRYAHVVGHLYVGGSGLWQFDNLDRDPSRRVPPVRIRSNGDLADEVAAGFALAGDLDTARDLAAELLGEDWADRDVEAAPPVLRELGEATHGMPASCVVTDLGAGCELESFTVFGWSVIMAAPFPRVESV